MPGTRHGPYSLRRRPAWHIALRAPCAPNRPCHRSHQLLSVLARSTALEPSREPVGACAATPPRRQKDGPFGSLVPPLADTCLGRREGRTTASSHSRRIRLCRPRSPWPETTGSSPSSVSRLQTCRSGESAPGHPRPLRLRSEERRVGKERV